jgi:hypothetical protein
MLFAVGVTLAVCATGAAGIGLWTFQSVRGAEEPARQTAEAFLRDLANGDHDSAYGRLCTRTQQAMGRGGFADWFDAQPKIDRFVLSDVTVTFRDGKLTGTATAEVTWESGVVATQSLPLATDRGDWRVCGYPI